MNLMNEIENEMFFVTFKHDDFVKSFSFQIFLIRKIFLTFLTLPITRNENENVFEKVKVIVLFCNKSLKEISFFKSVSYE